MTHSRTATQVIDLGFGDAGKGTTVDALVRRQGADLVVRFNGGPQAGHNVVTDDGRHHTFSQFGSGTFVPGVRTLLARHVLIEPYAMLNEAAHLASIGVADAFDRVLIDHRCRVISPVQQVANRLREWSRGSAAHGTCGMGIGEAMQDAIEAPELSIRAADLKEAPRLRRAFLAQLDHKRLQLRDALRIARHDPTQAAIVEVFDHPERWMVGTLEVFAAIADHATLVDDASVVRDATMIVFEGAQGVLLDERHGFHPHTTWSDTTFANADALLDDAGFDGERTRIGVTRCYATRHGPGPFPTESAALGARLPEPHNDASGWQGAFRVGHFDAVLLRYALACVGRVDALAVTHLDRVAAAGELVCDRYGANAPHDRYADGALLPGPAADESLTRWLSDVRPHFTTTGDDSAASFVAFVERVAPVPVAIESFGPIAADKRWRVTAGAAVVP